MRVHLAGFHVWQHGALQEQPSERSCPVLAEMIGPDALGETM